MTLKAGITIDITFDHKSLNTRPLKSIVYDGLGKQLIVSQTSPPILPSHSQWPIHISYIRKKDDDARRFGFSAAVSGFLKHYELASGVRVPALVIDMTSKPEEINLRSRYRIRPAGMSGLSVILMGRTHTIFDISLTGINFIQPLWEHPLQPSEALKLLLHVDGKGYPVEARVVRVSQTREFRFIAATFIRMNNDLHTLLGKKILMLERKALSRFWR